MKSQNLPTTMETLKHVFELQSEGKFNFVPVLQGNPGMAKTSFIKALAKELDYNLYMVSGAKPMEFFSGLPITDRAIAENGEVGKAIWTQPEIIGHANDLAVEKPLILFIDDIHLIGDASEYFFELLLEKSLNNHKLTKNIYMVGASNSSELSGYKGFPAAIINRMMLIQVNLSMDTWYKNVGIGLNSYVTTFMKTHPEFNQEDENTESPFATFRSWTEYAHLYEKMSKNLNDEQEIELVDLLAPSFVSNAAVIALKESTRVQQKFNFVAILGKKEIPLPKSDMVEQIIYANIVKSCSTDIHFKKLSDLIVKASEASGYSTFLLNVVLEIISLKDYLSKNEPKSEKIDLMDSILIDLAMIDSLSDLILKYA